MSGTRIPIRQLRRHVLRQFQVIFFLVLICYNFLGYRNHYGLVSSATNRAEWMDCLDTYGVGNLTGSENKPATCTGYIYFIYFNLKCNFKKRILFGCGDRASCFGLVYSSILSYCRKLRPYIECAKHVTTVEAEKELIEGFGNSVMAYFYYHYECPGPYLYF